MDIKTAQSFLKELNAQLEEIDEKNRDRHKLDAFKRRARMLIMQIFGAQSLYLTDLSDITFVGFYDDNEADYRKSWGDGWNKAHNLVNTMIEELELSSKGLPEATGQGIPTSKRVFVVHGHNEEMKQSVARVLQILHLEPIILHEQPNKGRTIIEKLSDYADVNFAIILLSPDDVGYAKDEGAGSAKFRARQNVVLELGYFLGRLSRSSVLALYSQQTNFDIPSDYQGVIFIPFDDLESWKISLVKELQACGFSVDANDLTRA